MDCRTYFYDGTWQGILTIYHLVLAGNIVEGAFEKEDKEMKQDDLFSEKLFIKSDLEKSDEMTKEILNKCGSENYNMMMWAFLSEKRLIESYIFEFLRFALETGKEALSYLSDDRVMRVYSAAQQVKKEAHRFKGFIRFEEIKPNMFYAGIEPDNNIIMVLAPHFKNRLSSQDWIIHDKKRGTAVFFDRVGCVYREVLSFEFPKDSIEEKEYKFMWSKYFNAMGIKERRNPVLQRQFVPMKYRKNMVEFNKNDTSGKTF